jgi:predicted transcriptional regulator
MSATLTIQLDDELDRLLEQVSTGSGRNRAEVALEALRRQLSVAAFDQLRSRAMPFAAARGFVTDEDVFKAVS